MNHRRFLSVTALVLAVAALVWALFLVFVGGLHFEVRGHPVSSNEPLRPLAVVALALTVFVLAHGVDRSYARWMAMTRAVSDRALAVALAGIVTIVGVVYGTTAASGPDQYGYVSQADLWIERSLHVPQPWAAHVPWPSKRWSFAPLGYRPVEEEGRWENVPTYSPGLPLLMAAAKLGAGQEAMFLVVPLLGGLMVLATWGIGCRLGSSRAGVIAAWLVATSPAFLLHLVVPMSDIPTATAWTGAVFFLLGGGLPATAAAGVAAGVGLMIRPNLLPIAAILGVFAVWRQGPRLANRRLAYALAFGIPVAVAAVAVGTIYQSLYGSPFVSGYGRLSDQFAWAHVVPNIRNYLRWFVETQTMAGLAGLAAVLVPLRRLWEDADRRALAAIAALVVATCAQYMAYLVFDDFSYLRFLLVTWPFVMLGVGVVATALVRLARPGVTLATTGVVLALGIMGWRDAARAGTFEAWRDDRRFVAAARLVRDLTPPNSAVLAMIHSGSLRYYGGRLTIRYDVLDHDWLDQGVAWLNARGVRVYALLEEWEMAPFAARFAGERLARRLDETPLAVAADGAFRLYDLSESPAHGVAAASAVAVDDMPGRLRSQSPAPTPALVFAP